MLNIFVLGMDEPNEAELRALPDASEYRFHRLLTLDELRHHDEIPIADLLDEARTQLASFEGSIDAIIGFWDFPVTQMSAVLNREFGLRSASLEAVLKCEHKFWSRLVQREVIDEVPRFDLKLATGTQVTVEGYRQDGDVVIYGVVDSITYPDAPSFLRYQYPSQLPGDVISRMADISRRVVTHIGLDDSTFNIEYFWDPHRQEIKLLEINPRHSQSHARLFELVDGLPNHKCMIDLALGRKPVLQHDAGPFTVAAKWFPRLFSDGVVRRRPTPSEIEAIEAAIPGTSIEVIVEEGGRLSDLPDQDSYSYGLANIYIGADSEPELVDKYDRFLRALPVEFADPKPRTEARS